MTILSALPAKVSATLVDADGETQVWKIADLRGYIKAYDTIRIGPASSSGATRYSVETLRRDGWAYLLGGDRVFCPSCHSVYQHAAACTNGLALGLDYDTAILRAVAVLFGPENHG